MLYVHNYSICCFISNSIIIIILSTFIPCNHAAPRGPIENIGINEDLKPIGKLAYSFENVPQQPQLPAMAAIGADQTLPSPPLPPPPSPTPDGGNFLSILNRFFEKNDIISSLFHLISKASEQATNDANNQEKQQLYGEKFDNERRINFEGGGGEKRLNTGEEKIMSRISAAKTEEAGKAIQFDEPSSSSSMDGFNIDSVPAAIAQPDSKLPPLNDEWKSTLFGPKGMLTEVFRFVNEKRKQGFEKVSTQPQAAPATAAEGGSANNFDFAKIFESLIKSGNNGFDEPKIPELPFIGICNRLNCGDIYKAVDQFKKSEMFSNFQTALSLLHDPKGLDIIGELLENPDLIEQYVGNAGGGGGGGIGGNIQGLLGKAISNGGVGKKPTTSNSMSVLPSDGDLGIDFTNEIDGGSNSISSSSSSNGGGGNGLKAINVATSIDSSGTDYYTSVDKTPKSIDYDYDGAETINIEETINGGKSVVSETPKSVTSGLVETPKIPKKEEPPLPELSFSVDETPEISSSIDTEPVEYGSAINVEETLRRPSEGKTINSEIEINKKPLNAFQRRFVPTATAPPTTEATIGNRPLITDTTTVWSRTTTAMPSKKLITTTPQPPPVPPRKNFRRSDDYYSMYYDS